MWLLALLHCSYLNVFGALVMSCFVAYFPRSSELIVLSSAHGSNLDVLASFSLCFFPVCFCALFCVQFLWLGEVGFDSLAKLASWLRLVGAPSPGGPSHLDCTPLQCG